MSIGNNELNDVREKPTPGFTCGASDQATHVNINVIDKLDSINQ